MWGLTVALFNLGHRRDFLGVLERGLEGVLLACGAKEKEYVYLGLGEEGQEIVHRQSFRG